MVLVFLGGVIRKEKFNFLTFFINQISDYFYLYLLEFRFI